MLFERERALFVRALLGFLEFMIVFVVVDWIKSAVGAM